MLILGGTFLLSTWVSHQLKSKFKKYSEVPTQATGADVAKAMLSAHNIHNVTVQCVGGKLTDHYNPMDRTVNLSLDVYHQNSIAALAVAAHEVGHAVQHAEGYAWLQFRSKMVPAVNIGSQIAPYLLGIGAFIYASGSPFVLILGIALFAITTLFSFITLPVEFDASNRALAWLHQAGMLEGERGGFAKDALVWAAMTYVVAALGSLAQLLYFVSMFLGRRSE